jgi:site-specific recombinase XerD
VTGVNTSLNVSPEPLVDLLDDWRIHLRARSRRPETIKSYLAVARGFCAYLTEKGMPAHPAGIAREHVERYLADLGDRVSAATVAKQFRSLQQLFKWLVDDGEIPRSPMERMKRPAVPEQPIPVLEDEALSALLAACKGNSFENRRDEAILRLFIDTGMRAGELVGLTVEDIDREHSVAYVMGKGGRGRACPYGARTADALRRYLRVRTRHPRARFSEALLLGKKGPMTDSGVRQMLERRCDDAGLPHVHPHQFRHTFAHRWRLAGGDDDSLMRLVGWRTREMLHRYGSSVADVRAREAHRRLALGDAL